MPPAAVPLPHPLDKLAHFSVYALAILPGAFACRRIRSVWTIAGLVFLAGIAVEYFQSAIPGRESSSYDLLTNLVGISLGFLFGRCIKRWI